MKYTENQENNWSKSMVREQRSKGMEKRMETLIYVKKNLCLTVSDKQFKTKLSLCCLGFLRVDAFNNMWEGYFFLKMT